MDGRNNLMPLEGWPSTVMGEYTSGINFSDFDAFSPVPTQEPHFMSQQEYLSEDLTKPQGEQASNLQRSSSIGSQILPIPRTSDQVHFRLGHKLRDGSYVWSKTYSFKSLPYPGQDSLQRVVIFGDMGKAERDGSNEYANYPPGSLNTTDQLINDLENIDIVFHIGDMAYANGYLSQWDQFTSHIEPIASTVPYMVASGNHERDWPGTGSFYDTPDSGGECGVVAETMFYVPAENRAKFC